MKEIYRVIAFIYLVLAVLICVGVVFEILAAKHNVRPSYRGVCATPVGVQLFSEAKAVSYDKGVWHLKLADGSAVDTNAVCVIVDK